MAPSHLVLGLQIERFKVQVPLVTEVISLPRVHSVLPQKEFDFYPRSPQLHDREAGYITPNALVLQS